MTHWADVIAAELMQKHGRDRRQVFATAITPSGPIHVGNMREVLTTEAIYRATTEAGGDAELVYIADDYDALRKVYPFLHADYERFVGIPLREIPAPDPSGRPTSDRPLAPGASGSYAEHFLTPFLADLEALGVAPSVRSAHAMYRNGEYVDVIATALDEADTIRAILERVSGRQLPKRWAPFSPQCPVCRRIGGVDVLVYEFPRLEARCGHCAEGTDDPTAGTFEIDVRAPGAGKLPWRIDWPARWHFLGVTFEAFGKDHGAKGGSWDTGKRIVREVFGSHEPDHVVYEFLQLKGKGAMHSSTGLAVSAHDMLRMTPPEVLRYLLVRQSPRKHIDFDPGLGLVRLVDEFDRVERIRFGAEENPGTFAEVDRTYELSSPALVPDTLPVKVPYQHLVTVAQMADSLDDVEAILRRSGELSGEVDDVARAALVDRLDHVRYWLDQHAPEDVRFAVAAQLPRVALADDERAFLARLADALVDVQWTGPAIHDAVYAAKGDAQPQQAFRALYQVIIAKDRGPRAGFFLASLQRDWVIARLREAAA